MADRQQAVQCSRVDCPRADSRAGDFPGHQGILLREREPHGLGLVVGRMRLQGEPLEEMAVAALTVDSQVLTVDLAAGQDTDLRAGGVQ